MARTFPPEHAGLVAAIVAAGGAIASEYAPERRSDDETLVQRDRLQAAHASPSCSSRPMSPAARCTRWRSRGVGPSALRARRARVGNRQALAEGAAACLERSGGRAANTRRRTTTLDSALAGGASSPVRSGWAVGGAPFVAARGAGAYAYDASRPALHRLRHGVRSAAVRPRASGVLDGPRRDRGARRRDRLDASRRAAARANAFAGTCRRWSACASRRPAAKPCRVRCASRARSPVATSMLKFAGNYHGHFDLALQDAGASAHTDAPARSGIPRAVTHDLARRALQRSRRRRRAARARRLAAGGDPGRAGRRQHGAGGPPMPAFSRGCSARATRHGALLIFDEIITWLRLGLGGAQARGRHASRSHDGREDPRRRLSVGRVRRARRRHGDAGARRSVLHRRDACRQPVRGRDRAARAGLARSASRGVCARWTRSRAASPPGSARCSRDAGCDYAVVAAREHRRLQVPPRRAEPQLRRRARVPTRRRTPPTITRCASAASCCRRRRTR